MKTVHDLLHHKRRLRGDDAPERIHAIAPVASVFEAIALMSERHVGALPVMVDDKLVGIISERDYARKVILKDKSSKTTRVSEVMTREVISVEPRDRISHCVNLMTSHHIRHLVVMNEGQVAGMLSLRDLFAEIIDEQSETIGQLEDYIRGGH